MPATIELGDENIVAGVRIRAPMMQIHTVAAGGGSICRFDGMRFRVGPESRRRAARAGLLSRRRAADGDRLQPRSSGRISAGAFPRRVRARRRRSRSIPRQPRARLEEVADEIERATGKR